MLALYDKQQRSNWVIMIYEPNQLIGLQLSDSLFVLNFLPIDLFDPTDVEFSHVMKEDEWLFLGISFKGIEPSTLWQGLTLCILPLHYPPHINFEMDGIGWIHLIHG